MKWIKDVNRLYFVVIIDLNTTNDSWLLFNQFYVLVDLIINHMHLLFTHFYIIIFFVVSFWSHNLFTIITKLFKNPYARILIV